MQNKHITKKLSAYLHHELPGHERQAIAEHLLQCAGCRAEHDQIKIGMALAAKLAGADAPENLWREIERNLPSRETAKIPSLRHFLFFSPSRAAAACVFFGIVSLAIIVAGSLFFKESPEIAENEIKPVIREESNSSVAPQNPDESSANQNQIKPVFSDNNSNISIQPPETGSNARRLPEIAALEPKNKSSETLPAPKALPAWDVETIAGLPVAGNQTISQKGKLTIGEFLETDANSRAKIEVANIGEVEIAPNSRVQLVNTTSKEHRLALKKGVLQAKIFAPPRLFIVDTPSAAAIDLGCEYTLEVDAEGNSKLHVTSGFVALERDGRESIVPAGAFCLTKKGKGLGTPFSDDASAELREALYKFDFARGASEALQTIIKEAAFYDSLTLWHLLSRVQKTEREKVFNALAKYVKPPAGVTREGIARLDKKMLDAWWTEIERVWFE